MLDFALLPPEVNSGPRYTGPASESTVMGRSG